MMEKKQSAIIVVILNFVEVLVMYFIFGNQHWFPCSGTLSGIHFFYKGQKLFTPFCWRMVFIFYLKGISFYITLVFLACSYYEAAICFCGNSSSTPSDTGTETGGGGGAGAETPKLDTSGGGGAGAETSKLDTSEGGGAVEANSLLFTPDEIKEAVNSSVDPSEESVRDRHAVRTNSSKTYHDAYDSAKEAQELSNAKVALADKVQAASNTVRSTGEGSVVSGVASGNPATVGTGVGLLIVAEVGDAVQGVMRADGHAGLAQAEAAEAQVREGYNDLVDRRNDQGGHVGELGDRT